MGPMCSPFLRILRQTDPQNETTKKWKKRGERISEEIAPKKPRFLPLKTGIQYKTYIPISKREIGTIKNSFESKCKQKIDL